MLSAGPGVKKGSFEIGPLFLAVFAQDLARLRPNNWPKSAPIGGQIWPDCRRLTKIGPIVTDFGRSWTSFPKHGQDCRSRAEFQPILASSVDFGESRPNTDLIRPRQHPRGQPPRRLANQPTAGANGSAGAAGPENEVLAARNSSVASRIRVVEAPTSKHEVTQIGRCVQCNMLVCNRVASAANTAASKERGAQVSEKTANMMTFLSCEASLWRGGHRCERGIPDETRLAMALSMHEPPRPLRFVIPGKSVTSRNLEEIGISKYSGIACSPDDTSCFVGSSCSRGLPPRCGSF